MPLLLESWNGARSPSATHRVSPHFERRAEYAGTSTSFTSTDCSRSSQCQQQYHVALHSRRSFVRERVRYFIATDQCFLVSVVKIVAFAARQKILVIYFVRDFVVAEGLLSYGASIRIAKRVFTVGRILKGAKAFSLQSKNRCLLPW